MAFLPFLRHAASDLAGWRVRLEQGLLSLPQSSGPERLRLLGVCGSAYRALGELTAAADYFHAALLMAREQADRCLEAANLVRLGVVRHHQERWAEAEACFAEAVALSDREPAAWQYRDFALQHWGKLCVEQGDWAQAQRHLEAARALRQNKGDAELLASTIEALSALDAFIAVSHPREVSP